MTRLWYRLTAALTSFKFGGMSDRTEFYQDHLDSVSRSFAFCIRQLPSPLREWVGLSYLLCRALDTIEDAQWDDSAQQMQMFHKFDRALTDPRAAADLKGWETGFHASTPEGELILLRDVPILLADFHALPASIAEIIRDVISFMSAGMQHFCKTQEAGTLRLKSLGEVNQYCFFVAGVVGELLAKVLARIEPRFNLSQLNMMRAHHFGLFLQKVNLLKDQFSDEKVGRHLVPSREKVEASSEENARQAFRFLLDIPREQVEFRRFCAWSLFLGLESLKVTRGAPGSSTALKVSRARTDEILSEVEQHIGDNQGLIALFSRAEGALGWRATNDKERNGGDRQVPNWVLSAYRGGLEAPYLQQLGLTS